MNRMFQFTLAATIVLVGSISVTAQDPTAIVEDPRGRAYVRVNLGKYTPPSQAEGEQPLPSPSASLFVVNDDNEQVQIAAPLEPCVPGTSGMELCRRGEFVFRYPESGPYDRDKKYGVAFIAPVAAGRTLLLNLVVSQRLEAELVRNTNKCPDGISLRIRNNQTPYDWATVQKWLNEFQGNQSGLAKVEVRIRGAKVENWIEFPLASFESEFILNMAGICMVLRDPLPAKDFAVRVTLNGSTLPPELGPLVTADELPGREVAAADDAIERNLDINGTLSSSVKNEEVPASGSIPASMVRKRSTRGALDLKFIPVSDVWHPVIDDNTWMKFLTPLVIDAKVSTGKIVEDTLSANRILIGIEGESRYRSVNEEADGSLTKVATHRIIYGFTHGSDRDFKQNEFTGKVEYKPVWWTINRPLKLNYTPRGDERVYGTYGYSFVPTFGFEIGKTYHRRNPAPAIKPSDTVRRLYFGLDASLEVTTRLKFSLSDIFYLRFETPEHRQRNYFKGQVEAPLGEVFKNTVHSFVFSFERGDLAPFASPGVNALKFGYRLQTNYCSPYCR